MNVVYDKETINDIHCYYNSLNNYNIVSDKYYRDTCVNNKKRVRNKELNTIHNLITLLKLYNFHKDTFITIKPPDSPKLSYKLYGTELDVCIKNISIPIDFALETSHLKLEFLKINNDFAMSDIIDLFSLFKDLNKISIIGKYYNHNCSYEDYIFNNCNNTISLKTIYIHQDSGCIKYYKYNTLSNKFFYVTSTSSY